LNRRDFVKGAGSIFAGAGFASACAGRNPNADWLANEGRTPNRYGVQLYSLRGLMQQDPAGTLAALARAGFDEVEFAGFYGRTAADMRRLLDANSLVSPAGHVSADDLRLRLPAQLSDARTLGWQWLIVPWIDQRERTKDGYRTLAADFNRVGAVAAKEGVRIGYHAEDYDFRPLPDGTVPFDMMLKETDPSLVDFELDLYWVHKGGGDPFRYLAENPGRFPLLHIKDISASGEMKNAGEGIIDFAKIIKSWRQMAPRHLIVENDEPKHPVEDVAAGLKYIQSVAR
jgi:sugar phosphate isomerase/epimerase